MIKAVQCGRVAAAFSSAFLLLVLSGDLTAQERRPTIDSVPNAEITYDGLYRINHSEFDEAWAKRDIDLRLYSRIMLSFTGIAYRNVRDPGRSALARSSATQFPISEDSRARLEQTLRDEFMEELEKLDNYELVTIAGPDVLLLEASLIDVVSFVPPEPIGRADIYLREVGEATLVLELRDSVTREIYARAVDRRAARAAYPRESNPITNWAEVRRLAKRWAMLLRERFENLATLPRD